MLLLVVLLVQIFHFSVVVLVLLTQRIDDFTLSLDFSRQVLVSLLHHQYFFFFGEFLFKELFFTLLLHLELCLELAVLISLLFFFLREGVTTLNQFRLQLEQGNL